MARVLLLMGGLSREREVSLRSGMAVSSALKELGHVVVELDVREDFLARLLELKGEVDVAFPILHGRGGEDGCLQAVLELAGIPYTGSGVLASALAINKYMSKLVFRAKGIPVADDVVIEKRDIITEGLERMVQGVALDLGFPCIVKPNREGSTVGTSVCRNLDDLSQGLESALDLDDTVIVEEYIEGREMTVGIIGEENLLLPVLEIRASKGIYDYECKYTKGMTEYLVPAPIEPKLSQQLQEMALKAHLSLGCEGVSRVDFMVDGEGEIYCLEINTIPGMTELSLIPKAAAAIGLTFPQVVGKILASARLKAI